MNCKNCSDEGKTCKKTCFIGGSIYLISAPGGVTASTITSDAAIFVPGQDILLEEVMPVAPNPYFRAPAESALLLGSLRIKR